MSAPQPGRALPLPLFASGNRATSRPVVESSELCGRIEDHELMFQLQRRESHALGLLFDRYSRLVFGIALGTLKDHGEAEDAVQDTFLYLYRRATLFDPRKGSAKAWIVQVAVHRALDRKWRLSRGGFYSGAGIDLVDHTLSGSTDLEREIGARLVRAQLQQAFTELSDAQRRTLELFYFEELEFREIAEKLNTTFGSVRHYYYRGLERLRKSAFAGRLREDRPK